MKNLIIPIFKEISVKNSRKFAFFNKQISEKYGTKCCRYNQHGKPMDEVII